MPQDSQIIQSCYDAVADEYARQFANELEHKPLDRELLKRFADMVGNSGPVCDLGCGPGQTTAYLHNLGVNVYGLDLSEGILQKARQLHPGIQFERGNMLSLDRDNDSLAGVVAFYAIVHFSLNQVQQVFDEIKRVLQPAGLFLFSYHIGQETIHIEEFLGKQVPVDFMFFQTEDMVDSLKSAKLEIVDIIEREPYPDVEYQSRRAYIFTKSGT
ncbi:MAG: class I SAM-dependent DNA methyltransferase [Planctomycetota bacterium]|jgi:SAM-dependent methyltransferase